MCVALVFVSCAPAGISEPGEIVSDLLYVADRSAGTLSLLDGTGAHALGRAVPVGPAPALLTAASAGRALVSSSDPEQQARLSLLEPAKPAGLSVRSVTLGEGSRVRLVASAGDMSVVLFSAVSGSALGECQLALLDLRRGALVARHEVCGPRDLPAGLAFERGQAAPGTSAPVAYIALWRASGDESGQRVAAGARVVAV